LAYFCKNVKRLHIEHVQNLKPKNKDLPNMKDLVKNDLIIYVHYYEHRMNSFQNNNNNNNFLFGEINDFFKLKKFQSITLSHDHALLWCKNVSRFGIFTNEEIENFVDKYLTIDQTIFKMKICNYQYINRNKHFPKKKKKKNKLKNKKFF